MLARELVHHGEIGEIRKVEAWYPQGWLATKLEAENQKQASWRVDPSKAGGSGCGGDIGTHAYEFVRFATGLSAVRLQARLKTFVPGRALDDDFTVLAELNNGGIATITASQVTIGAQNDNGFRVIGTTGTLEWIDHRPHRPQALRRRSAAEALSPGGRVRLLPGLDQALSSHAVRPSGRFSRGIGQPASNARMDDPRRPGRVGPQAV